jgi:hypothetical protein
MKHQSTAYLFATDKGISSLGINTEIGNLKETIGDHANKILQENEGRLMKIVGAGKIYTVEFD